SRAVVEGSRIRLVVDDSGARYPVTVDPVVTEAILTASDGVAGDRLGASVAVSGDTAVVGAAEDLQAVTATFTRAGQVYVMTRSAGVWTQQAKLFPSELAAGDHYGFSVAV